jgi:hypothetical protein
MLTLAATLVMGVTGASSADVVGTVFTYQGQLKEGGNPANGTYDFRFALYDDPDFGSQVNGIIDVPDKQVDNGLFTVQLDFGDVFDGTALWLWVLVRPGDSTGPYTQLWPRHPLTAVPYALYALQGNGATDHGNLTGLGDDDHPQYVLEGEVDTITATMLVDEAVTGSKIAQMGAGDGQVLKWNDVSSSWEPANDLNDGNGDCSDCDDVFVNEGQADSISTPMIQDGAVTDTTVSDVAWNKITGKPSTYPPGGTAGGDLAGAYPNPTIAAGAVTQAKLSALGAQDGYVLKTDGSSISWAPDESGGYWQLASGADIYYSAGWVGIGTDDPQARLDVDGRVLIRNGHNLEVEGNVEAVRLYGGFAEISGDIRIDGKLDVDNGEVQLKDLPVGGGTDLVISGSDYVLRKSSSRRYKHDVRELAVDAELVSQLRPVSFAWNSTCEADIGLIAEEVAEVLPDLVLYDTDGRPDGVKYDRLGVYLLQIVNTQKERIATQREQITDLSARLERLEAIMGELAKSQAGGAR